MYCISITYKNLTAKQRERFACSIEEQEQILARGFSSGFVPGLVLLMTCNRSEIYATGDARVPEFLERQLADVKGVSLSELRNISLRYEGIGCIEHLYRVTCGLDSAVLGEVEIIRQVREAYLFSKEKNCADAETHLIFQGALKTAKRAASVSQMTHLPVSVGTLAAQAALSFCREAGAQGEKHVLLVGASGQMGTIVLKNLLDEDEAVQIVGTSRNHRQSLQKIFSHPRVKYLEYDRRYEYLNWADVVVSVTSSPHYTFLADRVRTVRTGAKPQLYLDLAIPRDIDDAVAEIPGCKLRDMDDIQALAADNNRRKYTEAQKVETLVQSAADETARVCMFREFLEAHADEKQALKDRSAMWLLCMFRDCLDAQTFRQVLEKIEDGVFPVHDSIK